MHRSFFISELRSIVLQASVSFKLGFTFLRIHTFPRTAMSYIDEMGIQRETKYVVLQVRSQQGIDDANFEIKKTTRMRKLIAKYREYFVPQGSLLRLLTRDADMQFTKSIWPDDTVNSLGLKQGDVLMAEITEPVALEHLRTTSSDEEFLSELRADHERLQASSSSGGGGGH